MPDFFKNKNVASAVVERVPCSFAKAKPDGSAGTHYSVVLLDHDHNVLYVGSECEHVHGEGIQAVHELGGGTCYAVTDTFRKALGRIKGAQGVIAARGYVDSTLPPLMNSALQAVWAHSADLHNSRRQEIELDQGIRIRALQGAVDRVVGNMLSLTPIKVMGRYPEKVHFHTLNYEKYSRVFGVREHTFGATDHRLTRAGIETEHDVKLAVLHPRKQHNADYDRVFALRKPEGSWVVFEDDVKSWASDNHTVFKEKGGKYEDCIFCADKFERMYRHVQGAKHIDRVLEVVKLTCKATSKTGLRMLNNPRHRSMFLKPR